MEDRIQKLRTLLHKQSLDAALISSPPNIFYLTGYGGFVPEERDAFVLITKEKGYIFTHALYAEAMATEIPHLELVQITRDDPFSKSVERLAQELGITVLGFENDNLTVVEYEKLQQIKVQLKHVNLSHVRIQKEPSEIEKIRKACAITDKAYEHILAWMKPGITEKAVEHEFYKFFTQHDASDAFRSIVAFGKNASVPHHLSGQTILQENDVVLVDFGAKVDGYCADESRTFFIGKPKEKHQEMFEVALETQKKAIVYITERLAKGETIKTVDVDRLAREYIASKGYPPFPYSLGHGVALEVHEAPLLNPRSKESLADGMVFTLEPGIHIPGEFGVRIEDVFAIQENKLIQLTQSKSGLHIQ
jgi:Xaa-Pro aminopeptidase